MIKTITAFFDGSVFCPESMLELERNSRYRLTIELPDDAVGIKVEGETSNAWNLLAQLAGTVEAPPDWSSKK